MLEWRSFCCCCFFKPEESSLHFATSWFAYFYFPIVFCTWNFKRTSKGTLCLNHYSRWACVPIRPYRPCLLAFVYVYLCTLIVVPLQHVSISAEGNDFAFFILLVSFKANGRAETSVRDTVWGEVRVSEGALITVQNAMRKWSGKGAVTVIIYCI